MIPRNRRLLQGCGAALLLLAVGLLVLPRLAATRAMNDSAGRNAPVDPSETSAENLPSLGSSPGFTLTDQRGRSFDASALAGKVWVADFVFTRCVLVCPVLSRQMVRLQEATADAGLADATRFVSFSVDPEHDTPEVLAAYAERHGADTSRWSFLTGNRAEMWSLIRDDFLLLVSPTPDNPINPIEHSPRMLLIDRTGEIRGRYDGTVPEEVDALERDLRRLASRGSGGVARSEAP